MIFRYRVVVIAGKNAILKCLLKQMCKSDY